MKTLGNFIFQFEIQGTLLFDPGKGSKNFDEWWCLVQLDKEIASYYRWFLKRWGQETSSPNGLWGFHVSVIKGEEPKKNKNNWAKMNGKEVTIHYGSWINYSNGRHAWIDCYSDDLSEIREYYGLYVNNRKLKYHATLGRLKNPWEPDVKRPGTVYKDPNGLCSI